VVVQCVPAAQVQHPKTCFLAGFSQRLEQIPAVHVVQKARLPAISPAQDMVNGPGILESQLERHEAVLPAPRRPVKRNGQEYGLPLRCALWLADCIFRHFSLDNPRLLANLSDVRTRKIWRDGGSAKGEKPRHVERGEKLGNPDFCFLPAPKAQFSRVALIFRFLLFRQTVAESRARPPIVKYSIISTLCDFIATGMPFSANLAIFDENQYK
jgi:hypothetical protein